MTTQKFGGDWTEDKLGRVSEYLRRYNTVLKKQHITREYIDAFAGTGYREVGGDEGEEVSGLFPELAEPEVRRFLDGSARIALNVDPGFHRFTFIEKKPQKAEELEKLKSEFPDKQIRIECGDANAWVQSICGEPWNYRRAVLFLDPFGMQVSWETLEAVAGTRSIDAWILLPLCVAITRLLKRDGNIDEAVCRRLDYVFGERTWRDAFYKPMASVASKSQSWLLQDAEPEPESHWKVDLSMVEEYFIERLKSIFVGVASNPVRLRNSKYVPLYLLFFVAGNEKGAPIAVKIAESIMSKP